MSMISNTQRAAHIRSRVRDYVLYVAITFVFLGAVFVVEGKWGHEAFIRWGGLAIMSAALFGYFISNSRQFFPRWQFWSLTAILLSVHLTCFAILLTHVVEWKWIWFTGMSFEYPVFTFFRSRLPQPS